MGLYLWLKFFGCFVFVLFLGFLIGFFFEYTSVSCWTGTFNSVILSPQVSFKIRFSCILK